MDTKLQLLCFQSWNILFEHPHFVLPFLTAPPRWNWFRMPHGLSVSCPNFNQQLPSLSLFSPSLVLPYGSWWNSSLLSDWKAYRKRTALTLEPSDTFLVKVPFHVTLIIPNHTMSARYTFCAELSSYSLFFTNFFEMGSHCITQSGVQWPDCSSL